MLTPDISITNKSAFAKIFKWSRLGHKQRSALKRD